MTNVTLLPNASFSPDDTVYPEAQEKVVKALEELLEQAQRGEIQAFAFAAVLANGRCADGFVHDDSPWRCNVLMAAISYLQHRYLCCFNDRSESGAEGQG